MKDCSGGVVGLDELFGILLMKAPIGPLTARQVEPGWRALLREEPAARGRLHAYIHIPFCERRCSYCLFYSEALRSPGEIDDYLERRLFKEMEFFAGAFKGAVLDHFAVGGGTPSLLSAEQLERLFSRFHALYGFKKDGMAALECNPRDVTPEKTRLLKDLGITRLSMGVQSLDGATLRRVNRAGQPAAMTLRAIKTILKTGFRDGLSVDLIAGFPGEDAARLFASFETLAQLGVDTIYVNPLRPGRRQAAAAPGGHEALFSELARELPALAEREGFVCKPICGYDSLSVDDSDWCFVRRAADGTLRPHSSYGRNDEDEQRLPLLNNSILAFGATGRSRAAGRLFYWDKAASQAPFSPDEPLYEGYHIDPRFQPLWRRMMDQREKGRRARERRGASCLCQAGASLSADGNMLDFSELFEHSIAIESGGGRLGLRLRKADCGHSPLFRAGALALQREDGGGARLPDEAELLAQIGPVFSEVAGRHEGKCLAEIARELQKALSSRFGSRVRGAELRSRLAPPRGRRCPL